MALDPVTAGIELVTSVGSSLIKHFFPDPVQQAAAEQKMAELVQSGEIQKIAGQLKINEEEAQSPNWFVAGWRPACGWIGAFSLGYAAILEPLMRFIATALGYKGAFPVLDTNITMQILFGILGLGVYRTVEKVKGAESNR